MNIYLYIMNIYLYIMNMYLWTYVYFKYNLPVTRIE
jgi:hypothetical protein